MSAAIRKKLLTAVVTLALCGAWAKDVPERRNSGQPPDLVQSDAATQTTRSSTGSDNQASNPSDATKGESDTTLSAPASRPLPARIYLPHELAEIVRLTKAGIGNQVILAYIQRKPESFPITAEQIVTLRDVGVSQPVLTALIQHRPITPAAPSGPQWANRGPPYFSGTNIPPPGTYVAGPPPGAPMMSPEDFYNGLAPYGQWYEVPSYGWCWQPFVATNPGWQPYCDDGRWRWSDCGWYWQSGYPWGGGPFHYGRWWRDPGYGWLWQPGSTWAPAWVCWRDNSQYCGWAPLPPDSGFNEHSGFTFHGAPVGPDNGFGLSASDFTFVDFDHFLDGNVREHRVEPSRSENLVAATTVGNHFRIDSKHRLVDRGIGLQRVQQHTPYPIPQVAVVDQPDTSMAFAQSGSFEDHGAQVASAGAGPWLPAGFQAPNSFGAAFGSVGSSPSEFSMGAFTPVGEPISSGTFEGAPSQSFPRRGSQSDASMSGLGFGILGGTFSRQLGHGVLGGLPPAPINGPWAPVGASFAPAAGMPAWGVPGVPSVPNNGKYPWLPVGAQPASGNGAPWGPVGVSAPANNGGNPWLPVGASPASGTAPPWGVAGVRPGMNGGLNPYMPVEQSPFNSRAPFGFAPTVPLNRFAGSFQSPGFAFLPGAPFLPGGPFLPNLPNYAAAGIWPSLRSWPLAPSWPLARSWPTVATTWPLAPSWPTASIFPHRGFGGRGGRMGGGGAHALGGGGGGHGSGGGRR